MNELLKYVPENNLEPKYEKEKNKESESEKLNVTFVGGGPINKALEKGLSLFSDNTFNITEDIETVMADFEKEKKMDILFLDKNFYSEDNLLRIITKIRNIPNIKKQPAVVVMSGYTDSKEIRQKIINAGADVNLAQPLNLVEILKNIFSIPKFLSEIEDNYSEKALINKQHFYKEYKDKLMKRSDFTADTGKELALLENVFKENDVKKVLDAGGGEGRIAIPLAENGYEVVNVDSSEELIRKMNASQEKVHGVVGDLRNMPIKEKSQDAITYNWHVFCDILGNKGKRETLEEAYRVLNEGGVIVLDIPDRENGSYEKDGVYVQNPGGENIFIGYTPGEDEILKYLKDANFKDIEVEKWETKNGFKKITFVGKK